MNKSEQLAQRIEKITYDSPWHGSNLESAIMKVTAAQAVQRIHGQHNIAEIVKHMIQWKKFVFQKTFGDKSFDITDPAQDWNVIDSLTQGEWEILKLEFMEITGDIVQGLDQLSQASFSKKVPGRDYTYDDLFIGIVDHDLYHQGQIVLLYKMITS
jgi:uncharacterized damage-inducible protein DinB